MTRYYVAEEVTIQAFELAVEAAIAAGGRLVGGMSVATDDGIMVYCQAYTLEE